MTWQREVRHDGLHKYRLIKHGDRHVVEQKAAAQIAAWNAQWERKCAADAKREARENAARSKEQKKALAAEKTEEAQNRIQGIEETLIHTLDVDDAIEWDSLKNTARFPEPKPRQPDPAPLPPEPTEDSHPSFRPSLGLLDKIFTSRRESKTTAAREAFDAALASWKIDVQSTEQANKQALADHGRKIEAWEARKAAYEEQLRQSNARVDEAKMAYERQDSEAVVEYCDLVLSNSQYPEEFPSSWELEYQSGTKFLIVDYQLPYLDALPTIKEVKYIISRDEFKDSLLSDAVLRKMYDSLLYQIVLRTVHELFEADLVDALEAVVFNGYVKSLDKGTGQEVTACVLSLQCSKEEFLAINLANIDPKTCFKALKGVGSSKLHSVTPVAPILEINRDDRRFVQSYEVAEHLAEGVNLAALDWEDFEHLVREVFETEFAQGGGEVKVTQASRDGGVDAIAFDPDPIRGGKTVIQAKRYTNTVGVAAVRDLYGTVMNEGALKGILVTTSDYGPDAYAFAKDKPLTLLGGAQLLHLLQKHGKKARIDLAEAKRLLADPD